MGSRRGAALVGAVLMALGGASAGCSSSGHPGPPDSTAPQTLPPAVWCGFVPASAIVQVLGRTDYVANGSVSGSPDSRTGACTITLGGSPTPALEVFIGSGSSNFAGETAAQVRAALADRGAGWYVFPAAQGAGWVRPDYPSTAGGVTVTGALGYLARGSGTSSVVIAVRIGKPRPGNHAVQDGAALLNAVVDLLRLPAGNGS